MSEEKIQHMLNSDGMIAFNLTDDSLSKVLSEFCELINEQGEQINRLQVELERCTKNHVFNQKIADKDEEIAQVKKELAALKDKQKEQEEETMKTINYNADMAQNWVNESKEYLMKEISSVKKEFSGDYMIVSQQIKDHNTEIANLNEITKKEEEDLKKLQHSIESFRDISADTLSQRIDELCISRDELRNDVDKNENEFKEYMETNKTKTNEMKKSINNEFHTIVVEVNELRKMIVDAPAFEEKDVTDTEAIIRAIQRDSRRIDSFNETFVEIKNENEAIRELFTSLSESFMRFQTNMHEFVIDHNQVKDILAQQIKESNVRIDNCNKDHLQSQKNITCISDCNLKSMTGISDAFQQIFLVLEKMSARRLPVFRSFDDEILEAQRIVDLIAAQNDHVSLKPQVADNSFLHDAKIEKNFILPFVDISQLANVNEEQATKGFIFDVPESPKSTKIEKSEKEKVVLRSSANGPTVSVDLELRHTVQELKARVDESMTHMNELTERLESKMQQKTDQAYLERMFDTLKNTLAKIRNDYAIVSQKVNKMATKDELEKCQTQIATSRDNMSVDAISTIKLPNLKNNSHLALYGAGQFNKRNQDRLVSSQMK